MIFLLLLSYCFPIIPQFSNCTNPPPPLPYTDEMCFVTDSSNPRNSKRQDVLWNIQIVQCKRGEICNPVMQGIYGTLYYEWGLGYVIFFTWLVSLGPVCLFFLAGKFREDYFIFFGETHFPFPFSSDHISSKKNSLDWCPTR